MTQNIIESKKCRKCNQVFEVIQEDLDLYEKVSPVFGGKKYILSTPDVCPRCRKIRRFSWKNERNLYKNICCATGRDIVTVYNPQSNITVYSSDFWWSDNWDVMDYGREFDSDKTFFDQFGDLFNQVPKLPLSSYDVENGEYNNFIGRAKDCYYTFSGGVMERMYYCFWVGWSSDVFDGFNIIRSHNMYDSVNCMDCNNSKFLDDCENCGSSMYLKKCIGCTDCIACIGIDNAQYHIGNIKYSKEEYFTKKSQMSLGDMRELYEQLLKEIKINKTMIVNSHNCQGNYIRNSSNLTHCFHTENSENGKNIFWGLGIKDSMDCDFHNDCTRGYEILAGAFTNNTLFSIFSNEVDRVMYCIECFGCKDCFGCTGLNGKQYCILNKQYSKKEYEKLVPEIIEHMKKVKEWGNFFPSSLSPFGYNETSAHLSFPLSKQEAIKEGFNWSNYEVPFPKVDKVIPASRLPDDIVDIPEDILNWAIECEVTKRPFIIIRQELDFYRKHSLPIPRCHPDQRHLDRMKLRNYDTN